MLLHAEEGRAMSGSSDRQIHRSASVPRRCGVACLLLALLAVTLPGVSSSAVAEDRLRLQGSTTFNSTLLAGHQSRIERRAQLKLDVIANKSIWGLVALIEGRTDAAMISADLEGEVAALAQYGGSEKAKGLRAFEIVRSRVSFAVNPANPVRELTLAAIAGIMRGEIVNWKSLGGLDHPIRLVVVREGGGTLVAVRGKTIRDAPIKAPNLSRLESPRHVVAVVAQEPGAIGVAQLNLVRKAGLPEVETDQPVEQRLSIVTMGDPSPAVRRLIDAARMVAVEHLM